MQSSGSSSPETQSITQSATDRQPTRKRFALTGRSEAFDPRVDAARGDLADIRLVDRLFAPHYAAAVARTATKRAPIRAAVRADAPAISEILPGESFEVLELSRDHAWGVSVVDGTVGFLAANALGAPVVATHVVIAPQTGSGAPLPMGARVAGPGDLDAATVRPIGEPCEDFVALAEALTGTPYLEGGRSGAGVDAGGLVFLTLSLAGVPAPRFADLQATQLGHAVNDSAPMLRGDLLFLTDSVAIVVDGENAVHAGKAGVMLEPIAAIKARAGDLIMRRRLP